MPRTKQLYKKLTSKRIGAEAAMRIGQAMLKTWRSQTWCLGAGEGLLPFLERLRKAKMDARDRRSR